MKKTIFAILCSLLIGLSAMATDIMPERVMLNNTNTFGVYQVGHSIVIYEEPNEKSVIKQKIVWDDLNIIPQKYTKPDLFVVYIKNRDFALMSVTDETEDWVEVIYDNRTGETGWIKKDDPFKFDTWVNFYNMYGRKYGLKILAGAPQSAYRMYGSMEDNAKPISEIKTPEYINLNVIRGNWMLVTVVDADKTPKTGYIRWRSDDGIKYLFPDLK